MSQPQSDSSKFFGRFRARLGAFSRNLFSPIYLWRKRYRQAANKARFQVAVLSDRNSRSQLFLLTQGWRQSNLVRFIRKHRWLNRQAYLVKVWIAKPIGKRVNVVLSWIAPAISSLLTLTYYFRTGSARNAQAAAFVRARSWDDRPILLFTGDYLSIPELAQFAAELAEEPDYTDKVALIVPNSTIEAALRSLSGSASFVSMQQFWLDQSIDIENHDMVNRALAHYQAGREGVHHVRSQSESHVDLFELMYMDLHIEFVQLMRVSRAIKAAMDDGKTVIAVCMSVPLDQQWFCEDFLSSGAKPQMVTLGSMNVHQTELLQSPRSKPSLVEMIARARARIAGATPSADEWEGRALADSTRRDPRNVALICDAAPGSHFWPTIANLAMAAKQDQHAVRAVVNSPAAALALRELGVAVDEFAFPEGIVLSQRFVRAYADMIDELAASTGRPGVASDPVIAVFQRHLIARLANSDDTFRTVSHNYRVRAQIEKWLIDHRMGAVLVAPHWGNLAWAGAAAANALDIPTASTPAVSVAGNSASIVGWNRLDLVGCYGLQCQEAFLSQGYAPERLLLTGSVALDQAMHITRDKARERLKPFQTLAAGGRQVVLFATSGVNTDERQIIATIIEFCSKPGANTALIIRPHHSIGRDRYEEALAAIPASQQAGIVVISSEGTAQDNIAAADVVITDFSTIGAEAVLIGRPLLAINTTGKPFPANNYADLGVAVQANCPDEIAPLLQRLLADGTFWPNAKESRKAFTDAYNWGGDGQAAHRLLAAINRLAVDASECVRARLIEAEPQRVRAADLPPPVKSGSRGPDYTPARPATLGYATAASDKMNQSQDPWALAGQVQLKDGGASSAMDDLTSFAIHRDTSLRDTIALIDRNGSGIAVVIDEATRLLDVVTDGDIRRAILGGIDLAEPVSHVVDAKTADGKVHKPVTGRIEDPPEFLLLLMERLVLHQLPLLDREGRVKRIVHRDQLSVRPQVKPGTRAVVMAGGFGTRLRPLTERVPKPMLKVAGRPILEHTIRRLVLAGFEQIFISLYYLPDVITDHFGDGSRFGTKIEYIRESKPLGTAGAVSLADHGNEPMLIMNGDVMTDLNYVGLLDFHHTTGAAVTMAGAPYEVGVPFGVVAIDDTNNVTGLQEKPIQRFYINTGIYVASPAALGLIPADTVYNMTDLVERAIQAGLPAKLYAMHEYWRDIGRIEDLQRANLEMGQERTIR